MNKLNLEHSPYLQQHKDNPVHWRAWSEETLHEARQTNKVILVSIGYSTCHWCHVMAHESFEDPEAASLMNNYFINIKVDREERPDLDHYFMNAVQSMGISGGWPLHCFLTPDGKPFYGGTYFPPDPKYGRPSWKQVLHSIYHSFQARQKEINQQAEELSVHLNLINNPVHHQEGTKITLDINAIFSKIQSAFDTIQGGFGTQPKFPNTQTIQLLFHLYFLTGRTEAKDHALFTLYRMCLGGIYDHVQGGFSRYSVDTNWDVPHFEKMLYDHAQLIQALSVGYKYNRSPFFRQIIEKSIHFFETAMQDTNGLFYAAMDADSEGEEGSFYVWTVEELKTILKEHYDHFLKRYSLSPLDHHHTDKKVLRLKSNIPIESLDQDSTAYFETLLSTLNDYRDLRTPPSIDKKMIVSWNAMMVSAYLACFEATEDARMLQKAVKLMEDILQQCTRQNARLCRFVYQGEAHGMGFIEDYAYVIKALLDLYSHTDQAWYVSKARNFFELLEEEYKLDHSPLYTISSTRQKDFLIQQLDWAETSFPNPNAIISWASMYLYHYYGEDCFLETAKDLVSVMTDRAVKYPVSMASWLQNVLYIEYGDVILKTVSVDTGKSVLAKLHIPGLFRLFQASEEKGLTFCFDQTCHDQVFSEEEVVSLFSGFNKFPSVRH